MNCYEGPRCASLFHFVITQHPIFVRDLKKDGLTLFSGGKSFGRTDESRDLALSFSLFNNPQKKTPSQHHGFGKNDGKEANMPEAVPL